MRAVKKPVSEGGRLQLAEAFAPQDQRTAQWGYGSALRQCSRVETLAGLLTLHYIPFTRTFPTFVEEPGDSQHLDQFSGPEEYEAQVIR
jgi:hypothetical protein